MPCRDRGVGKKHRPKSEGRLPICCFRRHGRPSVARASRRSAAAACAKPNGLDDVRTRSCLSGNSSTRRRGAAFDGKASRSRHAVVTGLQVFRARQGLYVGDARDRNTFLVPPARVDRRAACFPERRIGGSSKPADAVQAITLAVTRRNSPYFKSWECVPATLVRVPERVEPRSSSSMERPT